MKLLFCDNTLWGLINFRGKVLEYYMSKGYSVVAVAPQQAMSIDIDIPKGLKIRAINLDRTGTNPYYDYKYYLQLKQIYREENPDYIFHYTIKPNVYGSFAAKAVGIPCSSIVAGLGHSFTAPGLKNKVIQWLFRKGLKIPEHILTLNQPNTDILLSHRFANAKQLMLMSCGEGVDLTMYPFQEYPVNEKPVFFMCCRMLWEKGVQEYFEAAKALHDKADFWLMGPIDNHPTAVPRSAIDEMVKQGYIRYIEPEPNVQQYLAKANSSSSSSYGEGLSRTLMEACAAGRPIICTNIPGCRETVDEGINGFMCEPKDSQSLIQAMEKFISLSEDEMKAMGLASRKKAEKEFDVKLTFTYYENILKEHFGITD